MATQASKKLRRLSSPNDKRNPIRVLYVEDAVVIRETISRLLELNGYQVAYAKNGQEGIEMTLRWQPDLILMDLRMPIMDGLKAITQLKEDTRTAHIPIFVVSAWSSNKERTQAQLVGADKFFVKPPDLYKLVEAIEETVAKSYTR